MPWGTSVSGARGTAQAKGAGGTSLVVTIANANIGVGEVVFAWAAFDNLDATGETSRLSISDSGGNVWTKVREHTFGTVAGVGILWGLWVSQLTTALTSGSSTVTFTVDTLVIARSAGVSAFTVGAGRTFQILNDGNLRDFTTTAGNQTYSSNASDVVPLQEYLWLGFVAVEARPGDVASDTDYTPTTENGTTGAPVNSNATGHLDHRISSALTQDTFDGAIGTSGIVTSAVIFIVKEVRDRGFAANPMRNYQPLLAR